MLQWLRFISLADLEVLRGEVDAHEIALVPDIVRVDPDVVAVVGQDGQVVVVALIEQEMHLAGDPVRVTVRFEDVDLLDHQEDGVIAGSVHFLLYKGDHYHLTILTEDGDHIWVDTNDIWDKGDLVGVNIAPKDLKITKRDEA